MGQPSFPGDTKYELERLRADVNELYRRRPRRQPNMRDLQDVNGWGALNGYQLFYDSTKGRYTPTLPPPTITFNINGTLSAISTDDFRMPVDGYLILVSPRLTTAGTSTTTAVLKKNGVTVATFTFTSGQNVPTTVPTVSTVFVAGDYFSLECTTAGTGAGGLVLAVWASAPGATATGISGGVAPTTSNVVRSVVAGTNVTVDSTDPANPIVAASGGTTATIVRKTADESVTSSAVLQNDNELLFAVAANEVWIFQVVMYVLNTNTTSDIIVDFTAPAGATGSWGSLGLNPLSAGVDGDLRAAANPFSSGTGYGGYNGLTLLAHWGIIVNGATAGNVNLQWAQRVSDPGATTVQTNSYIIAQQVA